MSLAQYRRLIKGSWSNTNEQKRLDQLQNEEENISTQGQGEEEGLPEQN